MFKVSSPTTYSIQLYQLVGRVHKDECCNIMLCFYIIKIRMVSNVTTLSTISRQHSTHSLGFRDVRVHRNDPHNSLGTCSPLPQAQVTIIFTFDNFKEIRRRHQPCLVSLQT